MKASCFTDAETQTIENFGENEKFEITSIKQSKIKEIVTAGDKYFRVVTESVMIDDESGKEKRIKEQILFGARDIDWVRDYINSWVSGSLIPTEIKSIVETKIIQVL